MKKEDFSSEQYSRILDSIIKILIKNGLKATSMDSIASNLQMSKRTLYEIFGSKEEMFQEAHKYYHGKSALKMVEIFTDSGNVMEAIVKCFLFHRDLMRNTSAAFVRDLEEFSTNNISENTRRQHYQNFYDILQKGVAEGYFRDDINLAVQCRMFAIQMEALKRTEELFPPDISLLDVFDNVIIGFLRAISSSKGLEELERCLPSMKSYSNNFNNPE